MTEPKEKKKGFLASLMEKLDKAMEAKAKSGGCCCCKDTDGKDKKAC